MFLTVRLFGMLVLSWTQCGAIPGPMCMDCTRLPSPSHCNHVIQCTEHEVCHVTQIVSDGGHVFYDTGCQAANKCPGSKRSAWINNLTGTRRATGDIETCIECCQGEYCNLRGCGSQTIPDLSIRGPMCFKCDVQDTTDSCETVVNCSPNNECFLSTTIIGLTQEVKYTSKCMSTTACDVLRGSGLIGKRNNACFGCCQEDFCNTDCFRAEWEVTGSTSASKTTTLQPTTPLSTTHLHVPSTTTATTTTKAPTTTRQVTQGEICVNSGYKYINVTHSGTLYHYCVRLRSDVTKPWQQAQAACKQDGGNLVVFHDKDEGGFFDIWLKSLHASDKIEIRYWVGATDIGSEGYWTWVDGVEIPPSKYADYFWPNEPNDAGWPDGIHENCAAANYNRELDIVALNDVLCDMLSYFICELKL